MEKKSIFSLIFAGMVLFSCGKKEQQSAGSSDAKTEKSDSKPANKFVGKWEIVQAEGDLAEMNKGTIYNFTEDEMSTSMARGKYTISGDTLIVNFEGLQVPFKYIYKWEGEKLKLDVLNSGGQKFVLEKR
ncbi:MAG: hypothetical protein NZ516_05220 [Raineya sp.]|nr:hypothetical protein [Raineya sp.]